jgi:DNA sulfur modification protein DndB
MGYQHLNGGRFNITFRRANNTTGRKQIDVFAYDGETVFVIECKSRADRGRRNLQKDIQETISLQRYIRASIRKLAEGKPTPKVIFAYVTANIIWSETDVERADDGQIGVITENELQYFDAFIKHRGPAGRYQVLAEFLRGQKIPALENVKLPAVKGKIGGETFYSFVASPRRLLPIAFINHHALNHPDGRPAYQRMISASRIKSIGKFIAGGGYFPTNILLNFTDGAAFDKSVNKGNSDPNLTFGWITLPNRYRSAWIIDGQHRLYGYSHLGNDFLDQSLFVLAFEKLEARKEADLFITINHEQKSVPKSLLLSLLPDLRMGDANPRTALSALGSAVIRALNNDKTSPLSRRFGIPGVPAEAGQNLTVAEAVKGLGQSQLLGRVVHSKMVPGPMSAGTDDETVDRARRILNAYFERLRSANPARWEAGQTAYVSVNPGLRAHFALIGEIVRYLSHKKNVDFAALSEDRFADYVCEIAKPAFDMIGSATDKEIAEYFSRRFGEGGVREYLFNLCKEVSERYPDFGSDEFKRLLEQRESNKIEEAKTFLLKLSETTTDHVVKTLKQIHGTKILRSGDQAYWEIGIESRRVKDNAYEAQQRDKAERRGPREGYLNVVDLSPDFHPIMDRVLG